MKPMIFNTEMTRAILEGRKTVTRRVVKPQPMCYGPNIAYPQHEAGFELDKNVGWLRCHACGNYPQYSRAETDVCHFWTPPYSPGDILYVRETWRVQSARRFDADARIEFKAGGDMVRIQFPGGGDQYHSRAQYDDFVRRWADDRWHPSIHMPREAARIFLRVTDVQVERLQDMNMNDVQAEGVVPNGVKGGQWQQWQRDYMKPVWDSTIKPADRALYGWEANPWVWVIKFERIKNFKEADADE